MNDNGSAYFYLGLPVAERTVNERVLTALIGEHGAARRPPINFFRQLAPLLPTPVNPGFLNLCAVLMEVQRHIIAIHIPKEGEGALVWTARSAGFPPGAPPLSEVAATFCRLFPGIELLGSDTDAASWIAHDTSTADRIRTVLVELLLLALAGENRALAPCRPLLDDNELAVNTPYRQLIRGLEQQLATGEPVNGTSLTLTELLRAPARACPDSIEGQLAYMRQQWGQLLPPEMLARLELSLDLARVEAQRPTGGPGVAQMLSFDIRAGTDAGTYPEYEGYSPDTEWMPNVVMVAKMTYVWLEQLSKSYGQPVERLDQIPDEELDRLARWGFTALWLIGVWERSSASQRIKQICGNSEAMASAYSLHDYEVARELGGEGALADLRQRCQERGIRLASDMVPNHTGLHSRWIVEHPDWFIQLDYPPYPAYSYTGPDLSASPEVSLQVEDGYWDRRDAAVVFRHHDHRSGRSRYIYHGNDGTSTPWNDTAQLNYLLPEVRQAVMETILHVARLFPIIRFDAAMTLAKKHYQRLWYPQPGHGGIPSRAEHGMSREEFDAAFPREFWREVVDRVAAEAPGTLLLAEAFWLMEGYFVRTLGMHRVYNSAFMNMLKMEENAKYRQTIKNVLEFDPRILQRFVNFMNNPDERTAVEQFGKEDKYLGACVLLVTMPGLPMFGHGQVEGFHEKYGMEYRRACWDEPVDQHLVWLHETRIFPLMKRRGLFSGAEQFRLFDFWRDGQVDENIFAYTNGQGHERALVVFHNRYADTAGWLHTSSAWTIPGEEGLRQTTLAAALGIEGGPGRYCRFREQMTGLQYLLPADQMLLQGLFLSLGPYQHQVFWDFISLADAEDEPWGELCRRLDGTPVADLDRELIQIRNAPLIAAWGELLAACSVIARRPFPCDGDDLTAISTPFARVAAILAVEGGVTTAIHELRTSLSLLQRTAEQASGDSSAAPDSLYGRERLLLLIWSVCRALPTINADSIISLGLDRALAASFSSPEGMADIEGDDAVMLLQALLALGGELPEEGQSGDIFSQHWCTSFLRLHESSGCHWFNKERFELLTEWLLRLSTWRNPPLDALSRLEAMASALKSRAESAGYRLDLFLKLIDTTPSCGDGNTATPEQDADITA